jgi:hypothetical protein
VTVEGVWKIGFSSFTFREDHALRMSGRAYLGEHLGLERGNSRKIENFRVKNLKI